MSWIKTISPDQADGKLSAIYQRVCDNEGHVDNVLQVHSLRPHTLEAHMAVYKATIHHAANGLPEWLLESIGVFVSRLNRCEYCDRHHSSGLKRLTGDEQRFEQLSSALDKPFPDEPFSKAEQVVLAYVRQLTIAPSELKETYIIGLREQGYSDGEILEINQVAAYFAYVNRSVLGLGVDINGEELGLSPSSNADMDDWQHQ